MLKQLVSLHLNALNLYFIKMYTVIIYGALIFQRRHSASGWPQMSSASRRLLPPSAPWLPWWTPYSTIRVCLWRKRNRWWKTSRFTTASCSVNTFRTLRKRLFSLRVVSLRGRRRMFGFWGIFIYVSERACESWWTFWRVVRTFWDGVKIVCDFKKDYWQLFVSNETVFAIQTYDVIRCIITEIPLVTYLVLLCNIYWVSNI